MKLSHLLRSIAQKIHRFSLTRKYKPQARMELDRVAVSRELLLGKEGLLFSPDFHDTRADALSLTIRMHDHVGGYKQPSDHQIWLWPKPHALRRRARARAT